MLTISFICLSLLAVIDFIAICTVEETEEMGPSLVNYILTALIVIPLATVGKLLFFG